MNKCEEIEYRLDYDQQLLHHISHISHSFVIKLYQNSETMNQQSDTDI